MKLILLSDMPSLGQKGDLIDVADGYARNFLLPKQKAMKATVGALAQADKLKESREAADKIAKDDAERIATQLTGVRVVIAAQAGDEGKLYGSITNGDAVEGILKFTGVELERNQVELREGPIRAIGLHEVWVKLHRDVEFPVTLDVIPA